MDNTDNESINDTEFVKQYDNYQLPPGFSEALRLLDIKVQSNMSNNIYQQVMVGFSNEQVSQYCAIKKLTSIVQIEPKWIDMCVKSCIVFTDNFSKAISCHYCNEPCYENEKNKNSQKKLAFFSLKDRFILQYSDSTRSKELQYQYNYTTSSEYDNNNCGNIFDREQYKDSVENGCFSYYQDIALIGSLDGYQIFRQKTDDCWIILFLNGNISPENRPKNLNTFLRPIIDELKELEDGVECCDGLRNQEIFILHAFVVSWSGNTPALTKLMCTTSHNLYQSCRYCELQELQLGSILFELHSTKFSDSFTIDIMHLLYENIPKYMLQHWYGCFYMNDILNNNEYTLQKKTWNDIGSLMDKSKKIIPSDFGHPPRNIIKH
ncbi:22236_t:CDS:2 [Gigaspora margarita]|uniref:22236_t:CDS:1 n=1 Tax=Gigaspora margarita TaxID=4874 RepID=A0ABN7V2E1_GIGMA|nr:22236_t:CDS:2 [Gigaspora margarita]